MPEVIALIVLALVRIVPLVVGSVSVGVPATAGAAIVTDPDVSPLTTKLLISGTSLSLLPV